MDSAWGGGVADGSVNTYSVAVSPGVLLRGGSGETGAVETEIAPQSTEKGTRSRIDGGDAGRGRGLLEQP